MVRSTAITRHTSRSLVCLGLAVLLAAGGLLVLVMRSAHGSEPAPLLPNLVADPPDNAILGTDSSTGTPRLLLRFDGYVHNAGPGALDFRGSREAPKVSHLTTEEVEHAREKEEGLPQKTEEELATPPMKASQRLFTTNAEETNIERPHIQEASSGEMVYVSADGHHHFHLQKVAKYSLWNASKTVEVAPSQKVGFCLEDSQHVELGKGPSKAVYADNVAPYRDFCQQYRPNATSLFEGISPGWRDVYNRELAFQWVDASNVLPGEYWLREDVNPLGIVKEEAGANAPAYAASPTIIPGFDALAKTLETQAGKAVTVTLASSAWGDSATPTYTIVSQPLHGTLGAIQGNQVTYTPGDGYSGLDSFTFSAADPNSPFPSSPAIATVSIEIGAAPQPNVSIGGAPASMIAGTSVDLSATVANDSGGVEWTASAGTFTAAGAEGLTDSYTAPAQSPAGGTVTIVARLKDDHGVSDQRTVAIAPVLPSEPAPEAPLSEGTETTTPPGDSLGAPTPEAPTPPSVPATTQPGGSTGTPAVKSVKELARVSYPRVMLIGRKLVMTTVATASGRVRLSAYLRGRRLGSCVTETPAGRAFTCQLTLGAKVSLRARISVLASLRIGPRILRSLRPAARVAQMRMAHTSALRHNEEGSVGQFWCSPPLSGAGP